MLNVTLLTVLLLKCVFSDSPTTTANSALQEEVYTLKYAIKTLEAQLEKWNNLFLTSLEPRLASTATSLANIDSNVHNLQERAHVWDTFQLHVSAWNDQLATLDRKADIISKGQEKIIALDSKINTVTDLEYKINEALSKIDNMEDTLSILKEEIQKQHDHKNHDVLFGEFAARGILSTIKMVEKKLDRLLMSQQNSLIRTKNSEEKPKVTIKCNTPQIVEELLNDISSKVDIIFDKISGKEENENEYDIEEYADGSGDTEMPLEFRINHVNKFMKKMTSKMDQPCKKMNQPVEELLERVLKIENTSRIILDKENINLENVEKLLFNYETNSSFLLSILNKIEDSGVDFNEKFNKIMESYFNEQRAHFESMILRQIASCKNYMQNRTPNTGTTIRTKKGVLFEKNKSGCEDLNKNYTNGVYIFGDISELNPKNRAHNEKYCIVRDDGVWTVIQNRDNYSEPQNFNLSWFDYKNGFGNLDTDFWFGNDFISRFSRERRLVLRIELENFDGKRAWAEYSNFLVLSEEERYQIIIGGYKGNASDSFSSHNNSFFSTFDRKNDQAPECCPCAVSYGGGWWFNSCFESNLNGIYYNKPKNNGYFSGIIWEHWLGNYSLKKTTMMVKPLGNQEIEETAIWPHYEDP